MMGSWQALLQASDINRDNGVTSDEVMLVVDQLPQAREQVLATADAMFKAVDANGNGEVSPAEYNQMIEAWKGHRVDTDGCSTSWTPTATGTFPRGVRQPVRRLLDS